MTTSVYFNNYGATMEQNLLQDLVAESIRINGIDVYYITRVAGNVDTVFNEDTLKEYNRAFFVDVYVKSVDGFEGEGAFLQKFNLEIRDNITFSISTRTFQEEIGSKETIQRPREGDLIYLPQIGRFFQVSYVEKFPVFLALGTLTFFDLKCEMFEYSGEVFRTGLPFIDEVMNIYSPALNDESINTENGLELQDEDGYTIIIEEWDIDNFDTTSQNDEIEALSDDFIDFTQINPFSENNP